MRQIDVIIINNNDTSGIEKAALSVSQRRLQELNLAFPPRRSKTRVLYHPAPPKLDSLWNLQRLRGKCRQLQHRERNPAKLYPRSLLGAPEQQGAGPVARQRPGVGSDPAH